MSTTSKLKLCLFGTPEILLDGTPISMLQPKRQALLFYLASTGQRHLRAQVASLFWRNLSDQRALGNLRKPVQQLNELFPHHFHADNQSIQLKLDANFWVDVKVFEKKVAIYKSTGNVDALKEAVGLYRNDFLAGFYIRKTPEFEAWQSSQRATLRETAIVALQTLRHHAISKSDLGDAIDCARQIVRFEPWREEEHLHLMQLLVQNDQQQEALRHYDLCRDALRQEMDAEPGEEIEDLYARLKSENVGSFREVRSLVTTTDYALVGRETEWKTLRNCWRRLSQPHFICIAGEPGIGKTRLAEELLMLAEQEGVSAVRTRSHALEGRLAYGPVADWLRAEPLKGGLAKLEHIWLTEVARILPELLIEHPDLPHPEPIKDNWQRKRLFEALAHAFTLTQRKILLVLDDLQWCDSDTLEWLQYLLESADNRFLVIGTVRPEEIDDDHPLHRIRQQLERLDRSTYLPISQLSQEAVFSLAEQVATQAMDERLSGQVVADTAGNPLFVIESVRMMESMAPEDLAPNSEDATIGFPNPDDRTRTMPPKMYGVIQSRLSRLSPEAVQVMQMGATIGRAFDVDLLAHAADMSTESVLIALDELWQQRVIRDVDSVNFDFSHDRIRDVAYGEIGMVMRRLLHLQIANAIVTLHDGAVNRLAGQLAGHYTQASEFKEAIKYYLLAAKIADNVHSFREKIRYLNRALSFIHQIPDRSEFEKQEISVLYELSEVYIVVEGFSSLNSEKVCRQLLDLGEHSRSDDARFFGFIGLRAIFQNRGEFGNALAYALKGVEVADKLNCETRLARSHILLAATYFHTGKLDCAWQLFEKVIAQGYIRSYIRSVHTAWLVGYGDTARAGITKGIALMKERQDPHHICWVLSFACHLDFWQQEYDLLSEHYNESVDLTNRYNIPYWASGHSFFRGVLLTYDGRIDEAVSAFQEGRNAQIELQANQFRPLYESMAIAAFIQGGHLSEALNALNTAISDAEHSGERFLDAELYRLKGSVVLLADGKPAEAEMHFNRAIDIAHQQGSKTLELRATVSLCHLWQTQGKIVEAHQLLAPIYGWFTEGFDTVDLKEAKNLLEELQGTDTVYMDAADDCP